MAGMAGPAATGLARDSDPGQFVLHIDRLNGQVYELQQQLLKLTTSQDDRKKKDVSETKAFEKVPHFNGDEKMFGDFEFKSQNCLRPYKHTVSSFLSNCRARMTSSHSSRNSAW